MEEKKLENPQGVGSERSARYDLDRFYLLKRKRKQNKKNLT